MKNKNNDSRLSYSRSQQNDNDLSIAQSEYSYYNDAPLKRENLSTYKVNKANYQN
jgi:hypothetical protein